MSCASVTPVIPTPVMELNIHKLAAEPSESLFLTKSTRNDFDDIPVERKLKREVSLPAGIENWNISNYDSYLNFDENATLNQFESSLPDDGIVPEGDQRIRCSSISSVSFHDDIGPTNCRYPVKAFSTVCIDSGSTCISSDISCVGSKPKQQDWLDLEETNLDLFLQEVPEMSGSTDTVSSVPSLPSTSSCDVTVDLSSSFHSYSSSPLRSSSFADFGEKLSSGVKRRLDSNSEDEVFIVKQTKQEFQVTDDCRYVELRRKNNIASKNCRKTRKEKQREMEQRVAELIQEKETLNVKVHVLEELIQAHKTCLLNAIVQRR